MTSYLFAALDVRLALQEMQRGRSAKRQGSRLFVRDVRGLAHDRAALRHRAIFRVAAKRHAGKRDHRVADLELGHAPADSLDVAGQLAAEDRLARLWESKDRPGKEAEAARHVETSQPPVRRRHGGRADADQDFVVLNGRRRDLFDRNNFGRAVLFVDGGFHAGRGLTPAVRGCSPRGRRGRRSP